MEPFDENQRNKLVKIVVKTIHERKENDSSIKSKVKYKRAQGECLGIGSRRRTRQAAKSHGETQIVDISVDIRMGQPRTVSRANVR